MSQPHTPVKILFTIPEKIHYLPSLEKILPAPLSDGIEIE